MRIDVIPDIPACVATGIEPVNSVEIDLSALDAPVRTMLASMLDGAKLKTPIVTSPEGLLAAVQRRIAEREAYDADREKWRLRNEAEAVEARARIDEALAKRAEKSEEHPVYISGHQIKVQHRHAVLPETYHATAEQRTAITAWQAECKAANDAADQRAIAEFEAKLEADKGRRAEQLPALIEEYKIAERWLPLAIVSDDGKTLVLGTEAKNDIGKVKTQFVLDLVAKEIARRYVSDGLSLTHAIYTITEGATKIPNAEWAALVADPTAVKPVYNFLNRVPGGFDASGAGVGDILVFGNKDRKGRKQHFDRVVVSVSESSISVARANDYVEARKFRKSLLAG